MHEVYTWLIEFMGLDLAKALIALLIVTAVDRWLVEFGIFSLAIWIGWIIWMFHLFKYIGVLG